MPKFGINRTSFDADSYSKLNRLLEWLLNNLDSENITSIDTSLTDIYGAGEFLAIDSNMLTVKDGAGVTRALVGWSTASNLIAFDLYNSAGGKVIGISSTGNPEIYNAFIQNGHIKGSTIDATNTIQIADAGNYFAIDTMESALQQLGSTFTNIPTTNLDKTLTTPLATSNSDIVLNYSTKNFAINASSELDTIQNIGTTDSVTFDSVTATSSMQGLTGKFGNSSDYCLASSDGIQFFGQASQFYDESQSLLIQNYVNPSADIVSNAVDGSVTFTQACNINDYAIMNIQINHGWKVGSPIYPHLHWWQNSSNLPNWLIQYRWQYNGGVKQSAWTNVARQTEAFPFVTGSTINQITQFSSITPTSDAKLSDIIQFRLIRDGDNDSSSFASTDLLAGNVDAMNFDVHIEIDTLGSRQEYIK